MIDLLPAIFAAAWFGVLTSISPCPLATNIAAVSFLARRIHSRRIALAGAVAYALGRAMVYLLIGLAVHFGFAAAPALSTKLQSIVLPFVGPLLLLVALVLLGWLQIPFSFGKPTQNFAEKLATLGLMGEFLLGVVFALSFCPASAALFFGALLPIAVSSPAPLPLLAMYGIATALPVGILAVLIAVGASASKRALEWVSRSGRRIQTLTAAVMLAIGFWLTLSVTFEIF